MIGICVGCGCYLFYPWKKGTRCMTEKHNKVVVVSYSGMAWHSRWQVRTQTDLFYASSVLYYVNIWNSLSLLRLICFVCYVCFLFNAVGQILCNKLWWDRMGWLHTWLQKVKATNRCQTRFKFTKVDHVTKKITV